MKVKNDAKLKTNNGKATRPAPKSSPNGGKKPFSVQGLPHASLSEKQLVQCARYQRKELLAAEKKAAVHVYRLGVALAILKPNLKKRRQWAKFLNDLGIAEATAWRATELYRRAEREEKVALFTITEAYLHFGIVTQPEVPADDDNDAKEEKAAEKGNKKKVGPTKDDHADDSKTNDSHEDAADEAENGERYDEADEQKVDFSLLPRFAKENLSDEYYTPDNATAILLPYLPKGKVWEFAWGLGHMARCLQSHGHSVVGDRDSDFLTESFDANVLVTNPPFSKKDAFLERAYSIGKPFAMLLPADTLVGLERYPLFAQHGLQLLIPNRRVHYIDADGRKTNTNFNSFWLCWKLLPQDIVFAELRNGQGGAQ